MKKRNISFIILIYLFNLTICKANGYNMRQISSKDGLSNSAVSALLQDKDGLMWIGTVDGLNTFDGVNIINFNTTKNGYNISGNLIESIIEAEKGIFWIHTNYGLDRYDKKKNLVDHFPLFKGKLNIKTSYLGYVFLMTEDGALHYYNSKRNEYKEINIPIELRNNSINFTIYENTLIFFTSNGFSSSYTIRQNDEILHLDLKESIKQMDGIDFCFFENTSAYIIDSYGTLYEYDLSRKKKSYIYNLNNEIKQRGKVSAIVKNRDDYFVGFKTDGMIRLQNVPYKEKPYELKEMGPRVGIFGLLQDKHQDIIWAGTDGQGLYMYSTDPYLIKSVTYSMLYNKIEKPIRALHLDQNKSLWIGTKGDGIIKIDNYTNEDQIKSTDIATILPSKDGLNSGSVYAFAESANKIVWIGTEEGLNYYSYRDNEVRNIDLRNEVGDPIRFIHSICESSDSVLWLATVGTGVIKVSVSMHNGTPILSRAKTFMIDKGIVSSNYFFAIDKANDSTLWFGNRGQGGFRLDLKNDDFTPFSFAQLSNSQTVNDVFAIHTDKSNDVWFGTSFGLVKYAKDGKLTLFHEQDGFPNNAIHAIMEDAGNNLWMSTNQGVIKFDQKNETFQIHNRLHGLSVTEFSDGAFFKDESTGTLYFGGINGYISIKESTNPHQEYMPPIYFHKLSILGKDYNIYDYSNSEDDIDAVKLSYKQNFFSISFAAIDYVDGNNYSYYYKIEGLNSDWIDNRSSNEISFTNMAPGKYILEVKYKNRISGKESPVYNLLFEITPPWYMSNVAFVCYSLLFLALVMMVLKLIFIRNENKRKALIEKLEQRHEHEIYESKLSFFTNIAHEFCTPLTLICGPCNRILNYQGIDSFVQKHASLIQQNAERLNSLIQDLIEFRRIETGNKNPEIESLHIDNIVDAILQSFDDVLESKEIVSEKNMQTPLIWNTDKGFLISIVSNLMSNALKYTNYKGEIKFDTSIVNNELVIRIANTGKGIKKEDLAFIFDKYNILDNFEKQEKQNVVSRNGLGLAITNSLVSLLGGRIDIESSINEWTVFSVYLPRKDITVSLNRLDIEIPFIKTAVHQQVIPIQKHDFNEANPTILIIDDDSQLLWFMSDIFASEFNVITLTDTRNIGSVLKETQPNIILCDVMMPGIDGITLTRELKSNKETAHIPMVLVSAKNKVEEQIEGLSAGAEMYIAKPFNVDYIKTVVNRLILRKEVLKDYFNSPISAFELSSGKLKHKEHRKFLQDIIGIINKNITHKELNTQFIALELNMSSRHLYRKLEGISDQNPSDMIRNSRLHIAKNLLLNTKMTIDEIIYKSGFSNRATFFKSFINKFGCTPGEYREKNMGDWL